jgi:hypothetical protein
MEKVHVASPTSVKVCFSLKPFVYLPNWLQAVFKGGFVFFFFIYFG